MTYCSTVVQQSLTWLTYDVAGATCRERMFVLSLETYIIDVLCIACASVIVLIIVLAFLGGILYVLMDEPS
jgi:hypothetical protein